MFAAKNTAAPSGEAVYIESVFSTYLYTGNGSVQTIPNSIALGSAYGGSVYFDGSGDYLTVASNVAFNYGTNDFTIEFWFYPTSVSTTQIIYDQRSVSSTEATPTIYLSSSIPRYYVNGADQINGVSALSNNQWYHIAVSRSGTSTKMFVNGTQVGSTFTDTTSYITSPVRIGAYGVNGTLPSFGFFSNCRVVKGTALYTGNFTPSMVPLTAISGTSLLTCQTPNATTDYSSNAFSITVTNAVAQNGGGPFTDSTANKGGMVWLKGRSAATAHALYDTARGATFDLVSNSTAAQTTQTTGLTAFNSNGFSIGALAKLNTNAATYASWTFRKQAKFFDVVTYTGNGVSGRTVAHNLGSVPGCIIVKCTSAVDNWNVYHRSLGNTQRLNLNLTQEALTDPNAWNNTTPTSLVFTVGNNSAVNANGATYVAYLFAHDAGGFGAAGTDNVISCGSYTGTGASGNTITLGYEPQWVLIKRSAGGTGNWIMHDTMRGMPTGATTPYVVAEAANAEASSSNFVDVTSTGFQIKTTGSAWNSSGSTYIYIAIRRGPMKTPTSGTSVYNALTYTATNTARYLSGAGFPPDVFFWKGRNSTDPFTTQPRLTEQWLRTPSTAAESAQTFTAGSQGDKLSGWQDGAYWYDSYGYTNYSTTSDVIYYLRRAPGFFDVVCYTGNGSTQSVSHNLGVAPELIIVKWRNGGATDYGWRVYHKDLGITKWGQFTGDAFSTASSPYPWDTPTSSVFKLGDGSTWLSINGSSRNFVAYLFASVPGVSKVGSYTGTGTTKQIDCGFTAGARFVMIKRTDNTGDWYIWDTARGIVSGNDPYLLLNSTAAEVTSTDYIDPLNAGFEISSTAPAAINANGGTFIFLAIA